MDIVDGSLEILGLSEIKVAMTDPAGRMISSDFTTVPGGWHDRIDKNLDGKVDERLMNLTPMLGEHLLVYTNKFPGQAPGTFSASWDDQINELFFFRNYPTPAAGDSIVFHYVNENISSVFPRSGEKSLDRTPQVSWPGLLTPATFAPYHFELDDNYDFSSPLISDQTVPDAFYEIQSELTQGAVYYWRLRQSSGVGWTEFSFPFALYIEESCCLVPGDASGDGNFNIADITFLIARIFAGGPAPDCLAQGDANASGNINISDVTFLIARIFADGSAPVCP